MYGGVVDDEKLAKCCSEMNLPSDILHDFHRLLTDGGILAGGCSGLVKTVVEDAHTCTWFTIQGIEQITRTTQGCRAGDPLADVFFKFCHSIPAHSYRGRTRSFGNSVYPAPTSRLPQRFGGGEYTKFHFDTDGQCVR